MMYILMQGEPVVKYETSAGTQAVMLEALVMQLRAMHARGATRLVTTHSTRTCYERKPAAVNGARASSDPTPTVAADCAQELRMGEAADGEGTARRRHVASTANGITAVTDKNSGAAASSETEATKAGAPNGSAVPCIGSSTSTDAAFEEFLATVRRRGASSHRLHTASAHQVQPRLHCSCATVRIAPCVVRQRGCSLIWHMRSSMQNHHHEFVVTIMAVQMGTARMGADPATSAVDTRGECHQVSGLWIADGCLLPTALGVNPMVTIEAMSFVVAQNLAEGLTGKPPAPYQQQPPQELDW